MAEIPDPNAAALLEDAWSELIDILRKRAIVETSSEIRHDFLFRVAELFEQRLKDSDEAIAAYNQVNDEVGPGRQSLDALIRLYRSTERWGDLLSRMGIPDTRE